MVQRLVDAGLLLQTLIWLMSTPGVWSVVTFKGQNAAHPPNYTDMTDYIENLVHKVYEGYPKFNNLTGRYPSPKGSQVIAHPKMDIWALETEVLIYVTVEGIKTLDVDNQYLSVVVEENHAWMDEHFSLMEHGYNVTDTIDISTDKIWTPEVLPDGVYKAEILSESKTIRVNLYDGWCYRTKLVSYTIPCAVNVQPFPFDIHNCSLRFFQNQLFNTRIKYVSAITDKLREKTTNPLELISSFRRGAQLNGESGTLDWIIIDFNTTVIIRNRTSNDPFESEAFELQLLIRRRSIFYATVLIFPCMLLNLLSFVIFTLPLHTTERENFALTLILTYFVLIMIVVDSSPSSGSEIPLLGLYIIISMSVVLVDFLVSLALIEIDEHCRARDKRMPQWMVHCLDSKCIMKLFTRSEHFKDDDDANANDIASSELHENDVLLQALPKQDKKKRRSLKKAKDKYKWKVLCKVLNFIFFVLSVIAHVLVAVVMYLMLPKF